MFCATYFSSLIEMIELFEPRMWFVPEGPGDPTGEPLGEAIAEIRR